MRKEEEEEKEENSCRKQLVSESMSYGICDFCSCPDSLTSFSVFCCSPFLPPDYSILPSRAILRFA